MRPMALTPSSGIEACAPLPVASSRARPGPASVTTMRSVFFSSWASAFTMAWARPGTAFVAAPPSNSTTTRAHGSMGLLMSMPS